MIRVNLMGTGKAARRRSPRAPRQSRQGMGPLPILWAAILIGALAGGFFWWSQLTSESARLDNDIAVAEARRAELQAVIDQDAIYEQRKATLESRVAAIEQLQRNRASPVLALDMLSRAVEGTEYVWISTLNQTNTSVTLSGTATTVEAIEVFLVNLEATGYFTDINLVRGQEAAPNYTFQLGMSFLPPLLAETSAARIPERSTLAGAAGPN